MSRAADLVGELLGDRAQQFDVDAHAARLHEPEHHHQRQLDLFVDEVQFPLRDLGAQVLAQPRDQRHLVGQRLVTRGRVEERRRRVDDRLAEEALRHLGQVVATAVGVEQERHDRGVVGRLEHHAVRHWRPRDRAP